MSIQDPNQSNNLIKPQQQIKQPNDELKIQIQKQQPKKQQPQSKNQSHQNIPPQQIVLAQQKIPESNDKKNEQQLNQSKNNNQEKQNQKQVQNKQQPQQIKISPASLDIGKIQKHQQKQSQQPEICLQIVDQIQIGSALLGSTTFRINGFDMHGPIDINRKITQFQSLRKILLQRWPGCFIPSLNDKTQIKNNKQKNLFKFRWLQHFLKGLSKSPFLYYKQQVQLFLRNPGMDYKQMFQSMPSLKAIDIIERFKSCFNEQVQKPSVLSNGVQISNLSTSLKKILHNLGQLSKNALILADSFDVFMNSMNKLSQTFQHYQQFALCEYIDNKRQNTLLMKDDQHRIKKLGDKQGKNVFYEIYQLIQTEAKDAQSFLDIILAMQMFTLKRDQLQNSAKQIQLQIDQIALGHKSMKVMTSRKTKQQIQSQLQSQQKKIIGQKLIVIELFNIVQIVLATKSISIFKSFKRSNYQKLIKKWNQSFQKSSPQLINLWNFVNSQAKSLKNSNKQEDKTKMQKEK